MGIDDYEPDERQKTASSSASSTSGTSRNRTTNTAARDRWQTKVDFGSPYVIVAQDRGGSVRVHRGNMAVYGEPDDWKRIAQLREQDADSDDSMPSPSNLSNKEWEVVYRCNSYEGWLLFCNHCIDQRLGDPNEILESEPTRLAELDEKVYIPPNAGPDEGCSCQVCGAHSSDAAIIEVQLRDHSKLHVCDNHSVSELAKNGFLQ